MKSLTNFFVIINLFFILGCQAKKEESYESASDAGAIADSTSGNTFTSLNREISNSQRKFIRTADLKFKVKDVAQATYAIETIINKSGGFVTSTDLSSTLNNSTTIAISADSSVETTYFTVANEMVLRVPNASLDSTLKAIAKQVDYLDYRRIKADDVALQFLANNVNQGRISQHEKRLAKAIDTRGKKLTETTIAEENLLAKQEQKDNARLANLNLQDQVNFSTVSLSIYQRQSVSTTLLATPQNKVEYVPGFGLKLMESVRVGWEIIAAVILFLVKLWGVFVFIIVAYVTYRKILVKFKNEAL